MPASVDEPPSENAEVTAQTETSRQSTYEPAKSGKNIGGDHKDIARIQDKVRISEDDIQPKIEGTDQGITNEISEEQNVFKEMTRGASFPGGPTEWQKYLERNLNAQVASDDGAPIGYYTVKVQFIVDKSGAISNVQAIEIPKACPSCGPAAVKVIQSSPNWAPAVQNGKNVLYQGTQNITFQVAEE